MSEASRRDREISRVTPHHYEDMPEHSRLEMGIEPGVTQCRQPIIGGGSCLLTKDTPFYHLDDDQPNG